MRAFVYTRQSFDRSGTGAAVDRQREECRKLCSDRGWTIEREYSDNDVSATSSKPRPAYQRMLAAINRGEAEVIIAWHVDRLTRKLTELEELIDLSSRTGVRIATVSGDLDLTTDAGRLVGRILASVARGEVERKGERQKLAQQQAAAAGKYPGGRRPFGYGVPTTETRSTRGVVRTVLDMGKVNQPEARELAAGYRILLEGGSLKSIARRWNQAGLFTTMGNTWTHSTVRRTLQNPRYAGRRSYRGEIVSAGTWPPIVDGDTFDAAVALLALPDRRTTATTARKYLLPAIALCGVCGGDMATGHTRHGRRVYVCRAAKHISRVAEPIDSLIAGGDIEGIPVRGVVVERLSRPDAADLLSQPATPDLTVHRAKAQAIRERLDDLATGLEEGLLTLNAVRKSSVRLRDELSAVEAKIHTSTRADVLSPLVTAHDVEEAWAGCDLQQRRAVIDALMTITLLSPKRGRNRFDPDTVQIDWKGHR